MITLEFVYVVMGILIAAVAVMNAFDAANPRRYTTAAFWGLYALTFLAGSSLSHFASGCLVLGMVLIVSLGGLRRSGAETSTADERHALARRWGNWLFVPALIIPAIALIGTAVFKRATIGGIPIADPKQATLIALVVATLVALACGMLMFRPALSTPVREARRLFDAVGWAAVLPQMLAALGALFAVAGIGKAISTVATTYIPLGHPLAAVATYTIGMALFTILMGNAFAAFPVMTVGIGLPLIVHKFGGDPAIMAAIGMLSGFCGTLLTPMAANFNVVPAALLELRDQHAVIRAQWPTALVLLAVNTLLMYVLVFRF